MTGLFGANAVRSPLADVPSIKGRNSQQLEAIIENALLPDTLDNARATLNAMRPITNASGFMAEVRPELLDPHTERQVLGVLNAGSTISAVDYDEAADRYLVRAELYEFLSIVAKRSFEADKANVDLAELEKIVGVALLPDINQNAETVLHYMHPIDEDRGFTAEINLGEVTTSTSARCAPRSTPAPRSDACSGRGKDANDFWIHRDLYKTLARIRARTLMADYGRPRLAGSQRAGRALRRLDHRSERRRSSTNRRLERRDDDRDPRRLRHAAAVGSSTSTRDSWERVSGGAQSAAIAANEAFARAAAAQRALDGSCASARTMRASPSTRRTRLLKSKLKPQASWDRQLLDEAYQELDQHWPVLMLLPNGPYEFVAARGRRAARSRTPAPGASPATSRRSLRIARAAGRHLQGQRTRE